MIQKYPDYLSDTAVSRKVGKSARDNPERYCGWFWVHCFSKKFQRIAREAMHLCLRVLKESNISRFDSYGVRKSALIISHITFRDCRVHSFSDNLSRNSCILNLEMGKLSIWFKANKLSPKSKTDQIYGLQTKLKAYELWYSNKYW